MDFSWLSDPQTWVGFITLIILEIVLGIDNLVFVAIIANKVKPRHRDKARVIGLSLAIVIRIIMLGLMKYVTTHLTKPFLNLAVLHISGKDLIMFFGGLFLLYKATTELHERLEGHDVLPQARTESAHTSLFNVICQIIILDAVFSLDSVITAVAMVDHITVAMVAVIVAMGAMIWASKPLTSFINRHPTVVMLCLGFLLMIGFSLLAEAFHYEIPKQYLYAAIGFSILIEIFNQVAMKNRQLTAATAKGWRNRTAESVLGLMHARETAVSKGKFHDKDENEADDTLYEDNEKHMIRSVLTLAERPILGIMTPRRDIEKLDISQPKDVQLQQIINTPFSRLVVIGKAGIDDPLGYVTKKELLNQIITNQELDTLKVLKQPLVLPEITTVLDAMEQFRGKSAAFAFVVDEFGGLLGILTIKDLLESIAGDFPEAYEPESERNPILKNDDGSLNVDASVEMPILAQELNLPLDEEDADYHTVAGFMIEQMERIPDIGDYISYHGWRFEVIEKEEQRIERIKISAIDEDEEDEKKEEASV